ncbi:hypothetical protein [Helicobacter sp.]|nr:hypothetical protein [Helicobacter sp.]
MSSHLYLHNRFAVRHESQVILTRTKLCYDSHRISQYINHSSNA